MIERILKEHSITIVYTVCSCSFISVMLLLYCFGNLQ